MKSGHRRLTSLAAAVLLLVTGGAAAGGSVGQITVGNGPVGLEIPRGDDLLYAAVDNAVAIAKTTTGQLISSIPLKPSPIDVTVDGEREQMWALQPDPRHPRRPGTVSVVDSSSGGVIESLATELGPAAVAFDPRFDLVYVVNFDSASIQVFDAVSFRLIRVLGGRRWKEGAIGHPEDIALGRRGRVAFVSTTDGYLLKLRHGRVVARKPVLSWADDHRLAVDSRHGLLYAAQFYAGTILELRVKDMSKVRKLKTRHAPWDVAIDPRLRVLGVVTDANERAGFEAFDLATGDRIALIKLGLGGDDIATSPGSWRFYVGDDFGDSVLILPGEDTPPRTPSISLVDGMSAHGGDVFSGASSDDRSGMKSVTLLFKNQIEAIEVEAQLTCSSIKRCDWTAVVPDSPGVYEVFSAAEDRAGNLEVDGEPIAVTVLP